MPPKRMGADLPADRKRAKRPLELCRCKVDPKRGLHNKTEESLFHSFVTRSPVRLSRIQSNHLGVSPRVVHLQNCHFDRNKLQIINDLFGHPIVQNI